MNYGGDLTVIAQTSLNNQPKIPIHINNKDGIIRLQISDNYHGLENTNPDILVVKTREIIPDKLKPIYKLAANNSLKLHVKNDLDYVLKYQNIATRENITFLKFNSIDHNQTIIICMVLFDENYYQRTMQTKAFFDLLIENEDVGIDDYIVVIGEFNSYKADEYDATQPYQHKKISQESFRSVNEFISSGFIDSFDLCHKLCENNQMIKNTYRTKYIFLSSKFADDEYFNLVGSYLYSQPNGISPDVVVDLYI